MPEIQLNEEFFAKIAGWEAIKKARAMLVADRVLSSNWTPPILKGVAQEGTTSYRAGLVIKSTIDIENLCACRESKSWGTICAHSVAVGLHHLQSLQPPAPAPKPAAPAPPAKKARAIQRAENGAPLAIHVILPPNLTDALARGKITLFFEGEREGRRAPLNTLPLDVPFILSADDQTLLRAAEHLAGGDSPAMLMIGAEPFASLLPKMVGHPRITIGKAQLIRVSNQPYPLAAQVRLEKSGEITVEATKPLPPARVGNWVFENSEFRRLPFAVEGSKRIARADVPLFLSRDWPALMDAGVDANFKLEDFSLEPAAPKIRLKLAGGLAHLTGTIEFIYGERTILLGDKDSGSIWMPDPNSPTRYSTRDLAAEQAAVARMLRNGFTGPHAEGLLQLVGQNTVLAFFAKDYQRLLREWEVTLEERLEKSTKQNLEFIQPRFEIIPSGEQWFDLAVNYASASEKYSTADIQRLLLSGQAHTKTKSGKFALIDTGAVEEFQEVLLDCAPQQHDRGYRMSNMQAGFLRSALQTQPAWQVRAPESWAHRAARQSGEMKLQAPPLGPLEELLRPYQKHGVAWLHFLRQNNFGGILADEMGLGKTLQTLAFLNSANRSGRPSLIVCPTSLVPNWASEVAQWTPNLKTLAWHGPKRREQFGDIAKCDLVITSYALIRRDADVYRDLEFDTVVLDEAQHIKNRQSQNAQAVKAVRAEHRLVLTGTPLENSVLDLWSIFDFLMPGYLGSANDFKERYEVPIVREKSAEAQARLARRIRPFLLRRLKSEVAKDLPAKIEQVSFCEMTPAQQAVYQQVLEAGRKEVVGAVESQGLQKSRLVILNALLRLRQICCDLRLLKLDAVDPATASGKLDLFWELLDEIIDGGHRALVFSQFVSMLTLIRERLDAEKIEYCYLDGSTKDRAGAVEKFQKNSGIPLFLISLKAGGVGLNLTGADTVIHFDPWWNPAVEDQATDRAHRIGQTKIVTSYKLIARGAVEEKILNLQNKKREMIKATLGEEAFAEALTWEEIQSLFE